MRPNYAQDAPPTSIEVGGASYDCETDYRVWLDVLRMLKNIQLDDDTEEAVERAVEKIIELEALVFGGALVDENPFDVLKAVSEFAKGYPTAPSRGGSDEPSYSFEYDLNEIIIAIRNQSGIDLSYRRTEPFHWWEFLLEFRTLAGEHYITNLMQIRSYKGKDAELQKLKREHALPVEYTDAERAEYEAWSQMFEEGADENDSH